MFSYVIDLTTNFFFREICKLQVGGQLGYFLCFLNMLYSIYRSEEATEQVEEEKEYNASGELVESRSEEGPWNRSMSEVQEQPKVAAPKPVSKLGKYVPPSMRRGNEQGICSLGRRNQPQKTFKKDSFIDFPTLNAAVQDQKLVIIISCLTLVSCLTFFVKVNEL